MKDSSRTRYFRGSRDGKRPLNFNPLEGSQSRYDVIVIGSGLGGMTAANILGRQGHRVCLLEQHYNLGGLATWFKRKGGHLFDVSLHGFPVGMKKTCRKYWGREIADRIVPLRSVRFDNPQFQLETVFTREDFTDKLVEVFGLKRTRVEAFYAHIRRMDFFDDSGETTEDLFQRFFPDRNDVHRLLMEPITYANGSTLQDPAISYGIVFSNFMSKGVYTFSGGTDSLIKAMKRVLQENKIDVFPNVQVDRIVVEDGETRGVEAAGRFIEAPIVVSNASVKTTVEHLVGEEHFSDSYVAANRAVRLNNSSTQVYMGLERGATLPFVTDLLFTSTRPTFDSPSVSDMHGESRTFSFYYPDQRPGSDRYAIVASMNSRWEDWKDLATEEYEQNKARLVADSLEALERYVPGTVAKINHSEAATPRTFGFYTQAPAGSSFGTKFEGLQVSFDLPEQVRGLFHTGSVGIIMSGWLGAANYGAIVANKADALLHKFKSNLQGAQPIGQRRGES
ncbi:MAG: all-trans-retinol 13,14-reductase [Planctomycetota bacterium]|jgi:all-trans-retinol 13,14-reductase